MRWYEVGYLSRQPYHLYLVLDASERCPAAMWSIHRKPAWWLQPHLLVELFKNFLLKLD